MSIDFVDPALRIAANDLRSEPRKPLCAAAAVVPASGAAIQATTANVSVHGVDLISEIELRPATRCEVAFSLPIAGQMRPVQLQACVVRSTPGVDNFSLGLVFFGMPPRTQELLESFVYN
ncbi:MAG TPA: PilZ domain-containing protein [Ideonella sp.]|uniref:PilZ domain-containing protein n=1 Tax=Ideonella sp. TaxID=1929293 RepID=UPI002E3638E6|nr:PilZ domain-containing protein [Ideonella sp.]HEX5683140.1 PilZ domain-containing protein [Ideonella sp.]